MNFISFRWDLEYLHNMVQEAAPFAVVGGLVAIAGGFLLEKPSMIFVGAIGLLIISIDYILVHVFGARSSD